jgi:transposase
MKDFIRDIILDVVKINCNNVGRKSNEPNEHFLDVFSYFVKNCTKWIILDDLRFTKYTSDNYRKKFHYWTKSNVFRDAFDIVSEIKKNRLVHEKELNCFIDGTNIRNINGSFKNNKNKDGESLLTRMYSDKFKRGLKVTVLITDQNHLLDIIVSSGGSHDITVVPAIYEKVTKNFKSSAQRPFGNKKHRINICGDKGYTSKQIQNAFAKKKIHYITPDKKNKVGVDEFDYFNKDMLKKRHKVENYFAHLKQFTRVRFMYEKKVDIYEGPLLLAALSIIK